MPSGRARARARWNAAGLPCGPVNGIDMSGLDGALQAAAPELGEQAEAILRDHGFDSAEITASRDAGVIGL